MFSKLRGLLFAGLLAASMGMGGAVCAQTVYESTPTGSGPASVGAGGGAFSVRITLTTDTVITAIGQETNNIAAVNFRPYIYDVTASNQVYYGPAQTASIDVAGAYSFKQSNSFAPVMLIGGHTYYIGLVFSGNALLRYSNFAVAAQNGISQTGYSFISDYNSPTLNNPGSQQFSLRLVSVPPTPVPTMSEWAMILFGTILAGGAALYIQRLRFTV